MAAYGGLVFGTSFSKQSNGQNIGDIFLQTNKRTEYSGHFRANKQTDRKDIRDIFQQTNKRREVGTPQILI